MQIGPGLDELVKQIKEQNDLLKKILNELQKISGTAR